MHSVASPVRDVSPAHLVQECHRDASSRGADGMPQRDGSAVDVDALHGELQLPVTGQDLRGERLVQLDQSVVMHTEAVLLLQLRNGGYGPEPHHGRVDARL